MSSHDQTIRAGIRILAWVALGERLAGEYQARDPELARWVRAGADLAFVLSARLAYAESQHKHPWAWGLAGGILGGLMARAWG